MTPKVSVIIPIYNVAGLLERTLYSVTHQTLRDIEIICVNDCSEDRSGDIIAEFACRDERIHIIRHERNLSVLQARKSGVASSNGQYIMFLDGDDEFMPDACERAYSAIEEYHVDIVHYMTRLRVCSKANVDRVEGMERWLSPSFERIDSEELIRSCFSDRLFGHTVWNKIYDGDLCRKVFARIEPIYAFNADDLYTTFLMTYYARSYVGIEDQLYIYNWGAGGTGGTEISLRKYDILLSSEKAVFDALKRFCKETDEAENLKDILCHIRNHFLDECVVKWRDKLNTDDVAEGFGHLTECWGQKEVIELLADHSRDEHRALQELKREQRKGRSRIRYGSRFVTARIDLQNIGDADNDIRVEVIQADSDVSVDPMKWLTGLNGHGVMIQAEYWGESQKLHNQKSPEKQVLKDPGKFEVYGGVSCSCV